MSETKISVTANGEVYELEEGVTIDGFLELLSLSIDKVVIERNKIALTRSEAKDLVLENNDSLEIVRIVAGG